MTIHYIDTETTGLRPEEGHEIIEIAIITEHPDGWVQEYCVKLRPVRIELADPEALRVNGYNELAWLTSLEMKDEIVKIAEILSHGVIVGHNVSFDLRFIEFAMRSYSVGGRLSRHVVDTMTLAHEHLVPRGLRYLGLQSIRKFMGWSNVGAHTALQDAKDCRKIYRSLCRASWRDV